MTKSRGFAVAVLFAACALMAQAPPPPDPPISYVASVKPNNDINARALFDSSPGGRFTGVAVTVSALVRTAYRVQAREVLGAPAWFSTKRYDIAAKAEGDPAPPEQALLRALLKDRFGLQVHREKREMPAYSLVAARSEGKMGPQLIPSSFDCAAYLAGPHAPPEPGRTSQCSARISQRDLSARAISIAQLATFLAPVAKRFTFDKTGLKGLYDVELSWTPDTPAATSPDALPGDSAAPSIFTAIQEQLGLKLVSDKGLVELLIVDHANEPSQN
jgi:uncharacterized protein (TIGR03435 family)